MGLRQSVQNTEALGVPGPGPGQDQPTTAARAGTLGPRSTDGKSDQESLASMLGCTLLARKEVRLGSLLFVLPEGELLEKLRQHIPQVIVASEILESSSTSGCRPPASSLECVLNLPLLLPRDSLLCVNGKE